MANANAKINIQNEVSSISKALFDLFGRVDQLTVKFTALDGNNTFADDDELNSGVTGLELKEAVASLGTIRDALVNSQHDTKLYKIIG